MIQISYEVVTKDKDKKFCYLMECCGNIQNCVHTYPMKEIKHARRRAEFLNKNLGRRK